jgi:hypothetical protein
MRHEGTHVNFGNHEYQIVALQDKHVKENSSLILLRGIVADLLLLRIEAEL